MWPPWGRSSTRRCRRCWLRPFQTSQTFRNLQAVPSGVFHVVDDVLLLAQSRDRPVAAGSPHVSRRRRCPASYWHKPVAGTSFTSTRSTIPKSGRKSARESVHTGRIRDFFGFNRAKHAVVEAAILATRVRLIPRDEILTEFARLKVPVDKTAGPREAEAFALLEQFVARGLTHGFETAANDPV